MLHHNHYKAIVFGHRSQNVAVDQGNIHFSMNEAFTQIDVDPRDGELSFEECLYRGFFEELGLKKELIDTNLEKHHFFGFIMDLEKFEMGLTSYAVLKLDDNISLGGFKLLNRVAPDANFETDAMDYIPLNDLENYLEENNDRMSLGARSMLKYLNLKIRYKHISLH